MNESSSQLQSFQNNERYGLVDRIENDIIQLLSDNNDAHVSMSPSYESRDSQLSPDSHINNTVSLVRSAFQSCVMFLHPSVSTSSRQSQGMFKRNEEEDGLKDYMKPQWTVTFIILIVAALLSSFITGQQSMQAYNGVILSESQIPYMVLYASVPLSFAFVSMLLIQVSFPHAHRYVFLGTVGMQQGLQGAMLYFERTVTVSNTIILALTYCLTVTVAVHVSVMNPYVAALCHPLQRSLCSWISFLGFFIGILVSHYTISFIYSISACLLLLLCIFALPDSPCDIVCESLEESQRCDGVHDCHCFMQNQHLTKVTSILQQIRGYSNITFDQACLIRSCMQMSGNNAMMAFTPVVNMGEPTFSRGMSVIGRNLRPLSPILDPFLAPPSPVNPLLDFEQQEMLRSIQMDDCLDITPNDNRVLDLQPESVSTQPSCTPSTPAVHQILRKSRQLFTLPYHPLFYIILQPSQCFTQFSALVMAIYYKDATISISLIVCTLVNSLINLYGSEKLMYDYSLFSSIFILLASSVISVITQTSMYVTVGSVIAAYSISTIFTPAIFLKQSNPSLILHAHTLGNILSAVLFCLIQTQLVPVATSLVTYSTILILTSVYILYNKS